VGGKGGNQRSMHLQAVGLGVAVLAVSCAWGQRVPPDEIVHRGVVIVHGASVSELAKGPALVHVYTESAGGVVYIAPEVGKSADECRPEGPSLARARLEPQRRLTIAIREGETVCLQTRARRYIEVLWHAHKVSPTGSDYRLRSSTVAARP
jgi:hypothetical protein